MASLPPPTESTLWTEVKYRPLESIRHHEPLKYYRPGGYHPVDLYNVLDHGRFMVVRKLGYGAFGTVWMCWDDRDEKLRALKIMRADSSEQAFKSEAGILALLSENGDQVSVEDAYKNHLGVSLEHFWHQGPNGRHLCLVMPVLGPTVLQAKALDDLNFLKDACAQVTAGLAFLHSKGITHGDLHSGNVLIQTSCDNLMSDEATWQNTKNEMDLLITEEDTLTGPHAPNGIYTCFDWYKLDAKYFRKEVAIIDFGSCHKSSEPLRRNIIHEDFRAPERYFGRPHSQASDLWALGCTMMYVLGSRNPFSSKAVSESSLYSRWEDALGPLPQPYCGQWISRTKSQMKPGEIPELDPVSWTKEQLMMRKKDRLREYGSEDLLSTCLALSTRTWLQPREQQQGQVGGAAGGGPARVKDWSLPPEEIESAVNLIKSVIKYNPSERTPARDLLTHPFLAGRPKPSTPSTPPHPTSRD